MKKTIITLFILISVIITFNTAHAVTLEDTLLEYESIAESGGWSVVPNGRSLKKNVCGSRVALLQSRLSIPTNDQKCFDEVTEEEVKRFQKNHGLEVDGIVGRKTLGALNVPIHVRIEQIKSNIERQRDFQPAERYFLVNIPAYELHIVENDVIIETAKVIVGTEKNKTPVLASKISYIELSPYWNIPYSIASKETLRYIKKDPNYLATKKIKVFKDWTEGAEEIDPNGIDWSTVTESNFSYKLRQEPGVSNLLGRMKFIFYNEHSVYLHDTNKRHLFYKTNREFSHGCVRVEGPLVLALYLLKDDPNWTPERLNTLIESGETKRVSLLNPMSIYLVYWTVWVDQDGEVNFRDDIYGLDK